MADPINQDISDNNLIARVREGHSDQYAELIRRHHPRVMALCMSILADRQDAEDAAQEAFLKAFQSLNDFRAESSFSTWIYRIAANKCLDYKRKKARERTQSLDFMLEDNADNAQKLLSSDGPEQSIEDAQLVRTILEALPEQYRLVLTLREVTGLSYQEIAEAMDCSVDSVKARLKRARREFLEKTRHFSAGKAV